MKNIIGFVFLMVSVPAVFADTEDRPIIDVSDDDFMVSEKSTGQAGKDLFQLSGFIQEKMAYSYEADDFNFSQLKTELGVRVDVNISQNVKAKIETIGFYDAAYEIEGKEKFPAPALDIYERDFRLQEAYLDFDLTSWFNLRAGRQYFSWGESEGNQISDIGNSRDYRELGLQKVDDARLPVGSTKFTVYEEGWEYTLIAIQEFRAHEFGDEGSVYDPMLALRSTGVELLDAEEPDTGFQEPEVISRLFISRSFGDISFFAGELYDDMPVLSYVIPENASDPERFLPAYYKYRRVGLFGNFVVGSWLLKYDMAKSMDKSFTSQDASTGLRQMESGLINAPVETGYLQGMIGVEYSGLSEMLISLEYYEASIEDYDSTIFQDDKTTREVSVYISRDFMNDRLLTTFWVNRLIDDSATMFRLEASYEVNDDIDIFLALSGINTSNEDAYFYDYRKTDRVTLAVKYTF